MILKSASPSTHHDSVLSDMYSERHGCYLFELAEDVSYFDLKQGQILHALSIPPTPNDIVVCPLPEKQGIILGRMLTRTGDRVIVEAINGLATILTVSCVLTVFRIS